MKICMKIGVNQFSVPWTRKLFPLTMNGVSENFLVCAQFSSKLAHGVPKVYALSRSYLDFLRYFIFMPKLCSGGFKYINIKQ